MMKVLFLLCIISAKPSFASVDWIGQDFEVVAIKSSIFTAQYPFPEKMISCREAIAQAVCLVDPRKEGDTSQRICLPGSDKYISNFEQLYDIFPSHLQRLFCTIKRIYIEKDFIASAYAGLYKDESKKVLGGYIGLRRSFLDQPSNLEDWASWKEQIHFGIDTSKITVDQHLPIVKSNMQNGQLDMLYFLVVHEFGHIFDFTNNLNGFSGCESDSPSCTKTPKPGSWGALSWKEFGLPRDEYNFPLRSELCFYFCNGKFISGDRQNELYESLAKTNFLSAYTTRFPTEDFADTFAYYTILKERSASYINLTASGLRYDPIARLKNDPLLQPKKQFIETFLQSKFKYPGE